MLEDLKLSYQRKNTQFILYNAEGIVEESDNVLFKAKKNSNVADIHPFFENIIEISKSEELDFSCVHLDFKKHDFICDIETKHLDNNKFLIVITDFSKHYKSFQSLAQSRNETAIHSEFLTLNNELLKEKEAFKNKFIANFSHVFMRRKCGRHVMES